jgi:tRNA threonylcarbamoyl adenosine modification protein (Sua5/YciO/YrdC/YwlC family)
LLLRVYPDNINDRHIAKAVEVLKNDGIIVVPTDTLYALACDIRSHKAFERISRLRQMKEGKGNFSFICHDLSHISDFTRPFNNTIFRLMKQCLPGPYTFILNSNSNVPSIFKTNKKTIGIRVPDNPITRRIVHELGHPIMVTTVHDASHWEDYVTDAAEIEGMLEGLVDLVIDGGNSEFEPSTVLDCTGEIPQVIREGKGKILNGID